MSVNGVDVWFFGAPVLILVLVRITVVLMIGLHAFPRTSNDKDMVDMLVV